MTAARSAGDEALSTADRPPPVAIGESFALELRLDDDAIRTFARQVHDLNPLHHDLAAARAAGYPGLIASGAHTGAIFMGMTATHFSSTPAGDGGARSVLGLGFDIRFRAVVFADEPLSLRWTVDAITWKASLAGHIVHAQGEVRTPRGLALAGTAALLVRRI